MALDPVSARHLAVALGDHMRRCERDGLPVPVDVRALFEVVVADISQPMAAVDGHDLDHPELPAHAPCVSYETVAARLGVSKRTVGRLVACGRLARVGRRVTVASLVKLEGRQA